jgi:phenylacetate-CoA ligase
MINPPIPYLARRSFWRERRLISRSERASRDELDALTLRRLRAACRWAYETTDYYRRAFDDAGIDPRGIDSVAAIRALPLLTKEVLQTRLDDLTSAAIPANRRWYVTTGGSTGTPVGFHLERNVTYPRTYAFEWRQYNWGGVRFFEPRAVLRGRVMTRAILREWNNLYLSAFALTAETATSYVDALVRFEPVYIEAYPSALLRLVDLARLHEAPRAFRRLKAVFLSSESATRAQADVLARAFGCSVFNKYGNSEQATIIGQCPAGAHHEFEEYAYTEYLGEDGQAVTEGVAEIVSTPFVNRATPLIRYRTGDLVELPGDRCPCGRVHRTVRGVVGRSQEYLLGRDGQRVSIAAINTHSDVYDGTLGFQYVQDVPGAAVVRVVPAGTMDDGQKRRIVEEATFRSGGSIAFRVEIVDALEKTARGKTLFIVRRC